MSNNPNEPPDRNQGQNPPDDSRGQQESWHGGQQGGQPGGGQGGQQGGPSGPSTPPSRGEPRASSSQVGGKPGARNQAVERRYGLSISEADRKKAFELEDKRWSTENQIKDWLKLLGMIVITIIWCLVVYFLEPGLR